MHVTHAFCHGREWAIDSSRRHRVWSMRARTPTIYLNVYTRYTLYLYIYNIHIAKVGIYKVYTNRLLGSVYNGEEINHWILWNWFSSFRFFARHITHITYFAQELTSINKRYNLTAIWAILLFYLYEGQCGLHHIE